MREILIALGSNLGDSQAIFAAALKRLDLELGLRACSCLYLGPAYPPLPVQPDFFNAVAVFELERPLGEILELLHYIENEAGRDRCDERRWGPRPLDLDLIGAPAVVHRSVGLQLPHPRAVDRDFVVIPAAELRGQWHLPGWPGSIAALAAGLAPTKLQRVAEAGWWKRS